MADDRTPHPTSLTESPPEDYVVAKKRARTQGEQRSIRLDHDSVVETERKVAERSASERPGSKLS